MTYICVISPSILFEPLLSSAFTTKSTVSDTNCQSAWGMSNEVTDKHSVTFSPINKNLNDIIMEGVENAVQVSQASDDIIRAGNWQGKLVFTVKVDGDEKPVSSGGSEG